LSTYFEIQFVKRINRIRTVNGGEYISNKFKDIFLTSGVIHKVTPPYSPESNGIAERFNHTINIIARSMSIAATDFPSLWAETINMAPYLKNRLPHKYLLSSRPAFERFHTKRPIISPLKRFGRKWFIHIREEEYFSRSKHLQHACEVIIVGYTSSPKIYRVFTFEDEYVFMTRDLIFQKKTSPQGATTLRRISWDPEPDPGWTPQDRRQKDASTLHQVEISSMMRTQKFIHKG
jgi:hypothetical protein